MLQSQVHLNPDQAPHPNRDFSLSIISQITFYQSDVDTHKIVLLHFRLSKKIIYINIYAKKGEMIKYAHICIRQIHFSGQWTKSE